MTLFRQYFRQQLSGLLIWVGIAVLLVFTVSSATTGVVASGTNFIQSLPEAFRKMAGTTGGLSPADAYLTMKAAPLLALLMCPYAVLLALGIVTREVDRRTIDFLLAMPVGRRQVLLARSAVLALNTAIMAAATWSTIYFSLSAQGFTGSFGGYALLLLNNWLLALALGALCLASSMWIDDYSLGVKVWVGVAFGGYVLEYALRIANVSRWARVWSPYTFIDAPLVVRDRAIAAADVLILLVLIAVGFGISVWAFERKQIAA